MTTTISTYPEILWSELDSPIGPLLLAGRGEQLTGLYFADPGHRHLPFRGPGTWTGAGVEKVRLQLGEYFAGHRQRFELDLDLRGTEFQRATWRALCQIPYGQTTSYGVLAASLGRPDAARAVGAANGRNPISIVVPCHRVIGADQSLTGYAWGIDRKEWLLEHERRHAGG